MKKTLTAMTIHEPKLDKIDLKVKTVVCRLTLWYADADIYERSIVTATGIVLAAFETKQDSSESRQVLKHDCVKN